MPFASYDDLIAKVSAGQLFDQFFSKTGVAAEAAGCWESMWLATGAPGAGANPAGTPGVAYVGTPSAPVSGALSYVNTSADTKHLLSFAGAATQAMTLMVYDRLYGVGGVAIGSTGNKALSDGNVALPRYTDGIGVYPVLEITTASTAAGSMTLASYTDHLGNLAGPGPAFALPAAATDARALAWIPLAAGSLGCRDVRTLNVAAAATTGVANVVLIRPLAFLPLVANVGNERDFVLQTTALPRVYDGACMGFAFQATVTTAPNVWGMLRVGYG